MRGIEFECSNGYGTILKDLLEPLTFENYDFYIFEDEIIKDDENWILPKVISGRAFRKLISESSYLVIFVHLQVYKKGAKYKPIKDYQDFINSNCDIVFLLSDNSFVEIYAKEVQIIQTLADNAEKLGYNVAVKLSSNDSRTKFKLD